MPVDRRQFLFAGGFALASCRSRGLRSAGPDANGSSGPARAALDDLLAAHVEALPEAAGSGANHYPMAAEALEAMGRADAIPPSWLAGPAGYAGTAPRSAPLADEAQVVDVLGDRGRYGDLLDHFRARLATGDWRAVVAREAPRLAPGVAAAFFHGAIRTAHAVRALERSDTAARRCELAVGLAWWAAAWTELPASPRSPAHAGGRYGRGAFARELAELDYAFAADASDPDFASVLDRLCARALVPPVDLDSPCPDPAAELDDVVHASAQGLREMLVRQRNRIWILHCVTAPAAVALLLPHVDAAAATALARHTRRAVAATFAAYAAPFAAGEHLHPAPPPFEDLVAEAAASRSVHTIKLIEALARHRADDRLVRSVAAQWLAWR